MRDGWTGATHTHPHVFMGVGLYAFGALILTALYTIAVSVKQETGVITAPQ